MRIAEALITLVQNVTQHPMMVVAGSFEVIAVTAMRRWGRAVIDGGDEAIRYYLPRLLRLPRLPRDPLD